MSIAPSPLFEPVIWEGEGFKILDETALPERVEYLVVRELSQALRAVGTMRTRAFGQVLTFLFSAALLAQRDSSVSPSSLRRQLEAMTERFCEARPTFDFKGLASHVWECFDRLPASVNTGAWIAAELRRFAERIVKAREARAERAAGILPDPARVLTHCNISGELVAVARFCKALGKDFSVVATETRPYLQGSRLTAWELARAHVPVSVIPDGAIAQVMAKRQVNSVLVGSDRSARNGDIVNKVGTYPLAVLAKEYGIPFHVLVQDPRSLARGADVPIEERPAAELITFQGQPLIATDSDQLEVRYPAFDMTPASLISSLVGFDDLYTPENFRQKYGGSPDHAVRAGRHRGRHLLVYGLPSNTGYPFLRHALTAEQAQSILVPEMRPELWGARIWAPELLRHGIATTLIADNMMGKLFADGEILKLYLFCSQLTEQGPVAICGSLLAVQLARRHGVGVELLDSTASAVCGADRDVSTFLGQRVCPAGVRIHPIEKELLRWTMFQPQEGLRS